ncbi:alanyl-tRNA synthetase [Ramicandelaber brevisporus]|nr:alanyl-tRNA synthetase [Ramicandelaber brevisporus]
MMSTDQQQNTSSNVWTADRLRSAFINFFVEKQGHKFVYSSPTIPHDDPTLLFANAGMNQFKPIFLGTADPNSPFASLKRAVNSQKCIRAGGKHNDLEDVGKDTYHHTFFEMLGNWSFGDYFKKEAISYAYEFLTEVIGLQKDRLYFTYFEGDEKAGVPADNEARDAWLNQGVPAERVLPFGKKDNFWEMGETGPCGPCTEIHYDRIGDRDVADQVNADDPLVIEIWNLVFIQFNREQDGSLRPLPSKHVDTGMGLERVLSALNDVHSNYDTILFTPIFEEIQRISGARPYTGKVGADDVDGIDMAYRVIADHVRTLTIAISDGGIPSNEGRGYVLRRILRRGARYARKKFNITLGTFFAQLVDVVVTQFGHVFPEVKSRVDIVKEILCEEEESFSRTLDRGERLFEQHLAKIDTKTNNVLDGAVVWRLYDTYGFPVDLTRIMAEENGLVVDEAAFLSEQEKARERSRQKGSTATGQRDVSVVAFDVHRIAEIEKNAAVPKTDDDAKYQTGNVTATVKALFRAGADGGFVEKVASSGDEDADYNNLFGVVLDRTNFYAEAGGQIYDTGSLVTLDGNTEFRVEAVQVYAGYILHVGHLRYGTISVGDGVECTYDEARRSPLRKNHTATHILNYALRNVLGEGIDQKGSLVAPEKLRFDFSFRTGITNEQLTQIEEICNQVITANHQVFFKDVPLSTAKAISSLRAVFGEVYPDPVRVVSIGADIDAVLGDVANPEWFKNSIEFCGGTHVSRTGEIKQFAVLEESSIAKGIRRIVAVTAEEAVAAHGAARELQNRITALRPLLQSDVTRLGAELKAMAKEIDQAPIPVLGKVAVRAAFDALRKEQNDIEKALKQARAKQAVDRTLAELEKAAAAGKKYVVLDLSEVEGDNGALNEASRAVKAFGDKNSAALLISADVAGGKVAHLSVVPKSLVQSHGFKASEWTGAVADILGGKKGGKDESAMGSGEKVEAVADAIKAAVAFVEAKNL